MFNVHAARLWWWRYWQYSFYGAYVFYEDTVVNLTPTNWLTENTFFWCN